MTNIDMPLPYDPSDDYCNCDYEEYCFSDHYNECDEYDYIDFPFWPGDHVTRYFIDDRLAEAVKKHGFTFGKSCYRTTSSIKKEVDDDRVKELILRHRSFLWAETHESDIVTNIEAIGNGGRILSWHDNPSGSIVIVTSENLKCTTVLYASEYEDGQELPEVGD